MAAGQRSTRGGTGRRRARKDAAVRRDELIEAAIACLSEGGLSAFTVERICGEAGVSRGLISHHFDGKDGLLVAVYERMTAHLAADAQAGLSRDGATAAERLAELIEASFHPAVFGRRQLRAWLALWSEAASDPRLQATHRARYADYRRGLTEALRALARERGRGVEPERLATMLIALVDGLWLEWCLNPKAVSRAEAKAACTELIESRLGPLSR